jgi:hypothetical protein
MKNIKGLKFQNDQKWPIKYTFLYPGGHEQSLEVCEHYLWHTRKKDDISWNPGPAHNVVQHFKHKKCSMCVSASWENKSEFVMSLHVLWHIHKACLARVNNLHSLIAFFTRRSSTAITSKQIHPITKYLQLTTPPSQVNREFEFSKAFRHTQSKSFIYNKREWLWQHTKSTVVTIYKTIKEMTAEFQMELSLSILLCTYQVILSHSQNY